MLARHALRRTPARVAVLGCALLGLAAAQADAAVYRTSISGRQHVSWKVDGTAGGCEVHRGRGEGAVTFTVKSSKAAPLTGGTRRVPLLGSIPSVATGSIEGRFADTVETPCPGFEPGDPVIEPVDGCGSTRFGIRVDVTPKGAFTYINGPATPLGPVSTAGARGTCPFPVDTPILSSNDFTACGDGQALWRRSWGIGSSGGQGLLASRISVTPKRLPRKGRTRVLTGRATVDCTMSSPYSGGVKVTGSLTYRLTVKRIG
jgi:hypothetical protein